MAVCFVGLGQQLRTDCSPKSINPLIFSGHLQVCIGAPSKPWEDAESAFLFCLVQLVCSTWHRSQFFISLCLFVVTHSCIYRCRLKLELHFLLKTLFWDDYRNLDSS